MDRRLFLFSSAGFAVAPQPYQPGDLGGAAPEDAAMGPPPVDPAFEAWKESFIPKAVAQGWSEAQVRAELNGLTPDPHVIALDGKQPELSRPISDYLASAVSANRIAQGQTKLGENAAYLTPIVAQYRVPGEIIVAIWGVESGFGAIQGSNDVIRSLATLAAQGRRRAFAEGQLLAALRIIFTGEATRGQLKGSWAGAMGQTQFTPGDYLSFAVDGDGDGRRDIWGSSADALASTANFLSHKAAWRFGESWAREVAVPQQGFDYSVVEDAARTPAEWAEQGVRPADGGGFRPGDAASSAKLLLPMGWQGPGFLAFPNHYAIRAYNNSTSYALAVGLLADRIAGGGPLVQPWPVDQPTTLNDRIDAQRALAQLGFDPGGVDGAIGSGTRKAVKGWQASQGLPADGYLSAALMQRLKAQAGLVNGAPVSPSQ
jgi:lytic murein transglycosylase